MDYPLVNIQITMEITMFYGKINYFNGPFSIVMLVYQTVFFKLQLLAGWWYTYPSEKYESQWEG